MRRAIALNNARTGQNPYDELDEEEQGEIDDIVRSVFDESRDNILYNPPDATPGFEAKAEELEREYEGIIERAYFSHEVMEGYLYFNGGMEIEIPGEKFENSKYPMPSDYLGISRLEEDIREELDNNGQIYVEEVDISDYQGVTTFRLQMSTDGYQPDPDGYESFLSELQDLDKKYDTAKSIIERYLEREGFLESSAFMGLSDKLEDIGSELKNFSWDQDLDYGEELIEFKSDSFRMAGIQSLLIDRFTDLRVISNRGSAAMVSHSPRFSNAVISSLGDLQQKIVAYLEKQLELPISDLPPKVVKQLTMPKLLKVIFVGENKGAEAQNDLQAYVTIGIDDTAVSQESIDATLEVVKFIDSNFPKIQEAVAETFQNVQQNIRDEAQARLDMLTDSTKTLLKIASGERETDRTARHYLSFVDDWKLGNVSDEALLQALGNLYDYLKQAGKLPEDLPLPQASSLNESFDLDDEIFSYLNEQDRSRQKGIYKFYCMLGYSATTERGLEDMLADARAIPSVTIVTVVVSNRRVSEDRYIAGISIKFIPSTPGNVRSPEDAKASILRDIRRINGIEKIFKVSSSVERIE